MRKTSWFQGWLVGTLLCIGCSHVVRTPLYAPLATPEQARLRIAELALARGEFEQAILVFDKILERDRGHSRALLGSARANLAAGRGEVALARYAAHRGGGHACSELESRQYCSALRLAADQTLASGAAAARALELAQRLSIESCETTHTSGLILRAELAVADEAREAGRDARALEGYLSLVSADRRHGDPETHPLELDPQLGDSVRARAYLAATDLLVSARRREEALALLSQGLGELPANHDLVESMVSLLAYPEPAVLPSGKTPVADKFRGTEKTRVVTKE